SRSDRKAVSHIKTPPRRMQRRLAARYCINLGMGTLRWGMKPPPHRSSRGVLRHAIIGCPLPEIRSGVSSAGPRPRCAECPPTSNRDFSALPSGLPLYQRMIQRPPSTVLAHRAAGLLQTVRVLLSGKLGPPVGIEDLRPAPGHRPGPLAGLRL